MQAIAANFAPTTISLPVESLSEGRGRVVEAGRSARGRARGGARLDQNLGTTHANERAQRTWIVSLTSAGRKAIRHLREDLLAHAPDVALLTAAAAAHTTAAACRSAGTCTRRDTKPINTRPATQECTHQWQRSRRQRRLLAAQRVQQHTCYQDRTARKKNQKRLTRSGCRCARGGHEHVLRSTTAAAATAGRRSTCARGCQEGQKHESSRQHT